MDETSWIIVAVVACLVLLVVGLALLGYVLLGAAAIFAWALQQGFIGAVVYFAAWVFMFPLMLVTSIIVGFFANRAINADRMAEEKESRRRNPAFSKKPIRGAPPVDPIERDKWANRLPPYDK